MSGANSLYGSLKSVDGVTCEKEALLSSLTSFRVGGPAAVLAIAEDASGLRSVLRLVSDAGVRLFVLGAGTNVIFRDEGFDGVVLKLGPGFGRLEREGLKVRAGAAASLSDVVCFCAGNSLSGLEALAGIPGSLGGAVAGNAGAFGTTVGEKVDSLTGYDAEGAARSLGSNQMDFGYRRADFGAALVLTEILLSLEEGRREAMLDRMDEIVRKRKESQPYELPCAGSIFKNPPEMKAARLIEKAGLKGRTVGGAEVSAKHANFIVNKGGASSDDVLSLIEVVREAVHRKFSVSLELEVKVVQ
ncbi:MAG: UDP-N-acetylmuramate dehydrogenase [Candidatus Eiseniibacteriota bacterium]|nr:MAG: UDP-N-acetylmuramate dehydrogenase [Candidatus Eisenbacteria bacterium]